MKSQRRGRNRGALHRMVSAGAIKAALAGLLVAALCAGGLWVLSREATLIHAAKALSQRLDGRLHTADLRGSLLGSITATEIRYRDAFGEVSMADVRFAWRPLRLLFGEVAVAAATAQSVALELTSSEEQPRMPPQSLALPISFSVSELRIDTLTVTGLNESRSIGNVHAAFSGNRKQLAAEIKSLATQYGGVHGEVKLDTRSPFALSGHVALAAPVPQGYTATARLSGNLLNLELYVNAEAAGASAFAHLEIAPYDAQPLTQFQSSVKDVDPRAWAANAPTAKISGNAQLIARESRKLEGSLHVANSEPGTVDALKLPFAQLSAVLGGTLKELSLSDIAIDLADAGQFAGSGTWRDGALDVDLDTKKLNVRGLNQRLHSTHLAGTLAFGGTKDSQRLRLDLAQRQYAVRFAGTLADGITIDELYARAGSAELKTRGRVSLDAQRTFNLAGQLRNFDPARFGAYPSHAINSRFSLEGHIEPVLQLAAKVDVSDSIVAGLPARGSGTFSSQRIDHPDVTMDVTMRVGATRANVKGIVRDPADVRSMDMKLDLAGDDLAELYRIIGVPLPPTAPYRITGQLVQHGDVWRFRRLTGTVGESDLSGEFMLDRGRVPQLIQAELRSNRLALADLSGFIGAERAASGEVTTPNPNRVLPESPYNLEKLKAADADVTFEGKHILTASLPVHNMNTRLVLRGGVLRLAPLNFGAAGGALYADITLDGRGPVIVSTADVRAQSVQLGRLLPQFKLAKASVGHIDGRANLVARGNSVASMLGTATGTTTLVIGEGEVSDLMLRLSNLDVANAMLVLMRGDRNIPIRCVVADLAFDEGIMRPRQFVFDTLHTTLVGEGRADFAREILDLRLVAKPKRGSLLSLRGPIKVSGTFAQPSVTPDYGRLAARASGAAALVVIAPPLAAMVPFVQLGANQEANCAPLMEAARRSIERPAPIAETR